MTAESISLLSAIFLHLSLILAALSFRHALEIIGSIARWHALPIFFSIITTIFAVIGFTVLPKVLLITSLLFFGATLIRSWKLIIRFFEYLDIEECKNRVPKD